jgi:hypothetical protein
VGLGDERGLKKETKRIKKIVACPSLEKQKKSLLSKPYNREGKSKLHYKEIPTQFYFFSIL